MVVGNFKPFNSWITRQIGSFFPKVYHFEILEKPPTIMKFIHCLSFDWKRPCFGGLTFKNGGHLGSRYVKFHPGRALAASFDHFGFLKFQSPTASDPRKIDPSKPNLLEATMRYPRSFLDVARRWGNGGIRNVGSPRWAMMRCNWWIRITLTNTSLRLPSKTI